MNIDDGWIPVKKYIEGDLGVNTEREQTYWDEWDEAALRRIIQQQRKITEASKKLEMKKLYQVLVVIDDFADTPQLHKPHGALDTLFIRGRHMQISTWVSSQKLRLISAAVRVNMQFLCCWRLRNQHELDAVIEELSALLPKEQLYRLYEQATREPYSFLFVYYLKPRNEMFYKRFEERFALEKDADGSGAQLPGPEAVRQLDADQREVCEHLLLHLRRSRPAAHRPPDGRVSKEKDDHDLRGQPQESDPPGRYLYWVDAALGTLNWALLPEGAYTGARLAAWISSNFATATYSETTNSLSVAYDGNRLILNDLELRQQFPDAADYPAAPGGGRSCATVNEDAPGARLQPAPAL